MRNLVLLLLLVGCAASGPQFSQVNPSYGKATIIVYRLEPYSLTPYTVSINGLDVCSLHHKGYFIKTIDPGNTTVSTSYWSMPGTSLITIPTKSNMIYYVKLEHNMANSMATFGGGVIGQMVYQESSGEKGPMKFTLEDRQIALDEIADTQMDCQ